MQRWRLALCWVTAYFKWSHDSVKGLIAYHNVYRNVLYPLLFHTLDTFVRSRLNHSLSFITYYLSCNNIRWLLVPSEEAISPFYIQENNFFYFLTHTTHWKTCASVTFSPSTERMITWPSCKYLGQGHLCALGFVLSFFFFFCGLLSLKFILCLNCRCTTHKQMLHYGWKKVVHKICSFFFILCY